MVTCTADELHDAAQSALIGARKMRLKTGAELVPTLLAFGHKLMVIEMPDYTENRSFHISKMKQFLKGCDAVAYVFVMEAWMAEAPLTTSHENLEKLRPSQHPNRKEILAVSGATKNGDRILMSCELKRDGDTISFGDIITVKDALGLTDDLFGNERSN